MVQFDHVCWSDECDDVPVHFQLLILAHQIYVWVGLGTPKLGNLCVATPTRLDTSPAVTALLRGPAEGESLSTAQRLAKKVGKSVALSFNIPNNMPATQAFAEKRLLQELQKLQLVESTERLAL